MRLFTGVQRILKVINNPLKNQSYPMRDGSIGVLEYWIIVNSK